MVSSLMLGVTRQPSPQVIDPGDLILSLPGLPLAGDVCHGQFPHPHCPHVHQTPLPPVKRHIYVVALARLDGVPAPDRECRVVHTELELCIVGEDVLEGYVDGVAWLDHKGPLRFGGQAVPVEWDGVLSPRGGGNAELGLGVAQVRRLKCHVQAGFGAGSYVDGPLHIEITAVDLDEARGTVTNGHPLSIQ